MTTMKEATDYIVGEIVDTYGVKKSVARLMLIDALTYNVVIEEIMNQIDFLIENSGEND